MSKVSSKPNINIPIKKPIGFQFPRKQIMKAHGIPPITPETVTTINLIVHINLKKKHNKTPRKFHFITMGFP
jgi:hypothetical protein